MVTQLNPAFVKSASELVKPFPVQASAAKVGFLHRQNKEIDKNAGNDVKEESQVVNRLGWSTLHRPTSQKK